MQQLGGLQRERQRLVGQQAKAQERVQADQEVLENANAAVAAVKRELADVRTAGTAGRCCALCWL